MYQIIVIAYSPIHDLEAGPLMAKYAIFTLRNEKRNYATYRYLQNSMDSNTSENGIVVTETMNLYSFDNIYEGIIDKIRTPERK